MTDSNLGAYFEYPQDDSNDPMVCTKHLRFVPCRKPEPHEYSTDPADVRRVTEEMRR